jgi:shikimate kinase
MDNAKRVVLTGFMGVGKSSVGRHLAQILKAERIDLDFFIEKNEKRKISDSAILSTWMARRLIAISNRQIFDGCWRSTMHR